VTRWRLLGLPASGFAAGLFVAACFELSGPQEGVSSISRIGVAWPSVVVGDVLRDVAGVAAPLHLDVYDGDGNLLSDATVSFVVLDTGLSVDADGYVHGLNERATPARIVAQARRGDDVIQTPEVTVDVVPRPDSTDPARDVTYAITNVPATDPAPIPLQPMTVKVLRRTGSTAAGVKSWLVRYEILRQPAGVNGQPTVLFDGVDDREALVALDTTDAEGVASRTLRLQRLALAEPGLQTVRVLVTIGNVRPDRKPTMFIITHPINVPEQGQ
jgi:hypothetical protein